MNGRDVQKEFLDVVVKLKSPVSIIVTNGFQLKGRVLDHDADTLLVEDGAKRLLVYKSAVSTIVKEAERCGSAFGDGR